MEKQRVAVVGCGSIGRWHARLLSGRSDVVLEICDVIADNLDSVRRELGDLPTPDDFQ